MIAQAVKIRVGAPTAIVKRCLEIVAIIQCYKYAITKL